jgi:hypothetical protein
MTNWLRKIDEMFYSRPAVTSLLFLALMLPLFLIAWTIFAHPVTGLLALAMLSGIGLTTAGVIANRRDNSVRRAAAEKVDREVADNLSDKNLATMLGIWKKRFG